MHTLRLANQQMGDRGARCVLEMICGNQSITTLDLTGLCFSLSFPFCIFICPCLLLLLLMMMMGTCVQATTTARMGST